jgi:serine/threonine-protein kinase
MATVYKAFEPGLERSVAVKVLPPEYLHDPTFAERFRREARVIARLEHPHIVPIYAYGIDQGMPWMSMRLLSGGSLSARLKSGGRLPQARSLEILRGVASALDYAHAAGVIHRDVKPQNILIDEHEHIYLADFGIAKMVEGAPGLTQTGMITGTPQYMAPEQALGSALDHRADIYSLGVVAYECLTGHVPFTADTPLAVLMKHVRDPIPLPPVSEVPEPLAHVLLKALAKAPGDRWPTAKAFIDGLQHASESATIRTPTTLFAPTVVSRAAPASGRGAAVPAAGRVRSGSSPAPWIAGAVLGAAVLAAAAWQLWRVAGPLYEAYRPVPATLTTRETPIAPPQTPSPSPPPAAPGAASPVPDSSPAATPPPVTRPGVAPLAEAPKPAPRPGATPSRPSPGAAAATAPSADAAVAPVSAPVSAPPVPEPTPTGPAVPERPRGIPFALGARIALVDATQSLVTLDTVQFKFVAKNAELQLEVEGHCREGKDQAVDVELELLDHSGKTVAVLKGRGTIEEDDTGKIRAKQHLTQSVVASIAAFRLTFQTQPD